MLLLIRYIAGLAVLVLIYNYLNERGSLLRILEQFNILALFPFLMSIICHFYCLIKVWKMILVSVGSINANNDDYPISTFSCRGPTQCPGDGSLSIYPEVVAPGQNVRSAWGKDEFNTISGTSMAAPHVSGVVLLLKEAFPFLTGQEILLALYNTATDLGEVGEDNTFGMGIIDAYAAFNYLANSYDPIPPNYIANDLVLLEITNIPNKTSCEFSSLHG